MQPAQEQVRVIPKDLTPLVLPSGVYAIEGTDQRITVTQSWQGAKVYRLRPARLLRCTSCSGLVVDHCHHCRPGDAEYDPWASDYESVGADELTDEERESCEASKIPLWTEEHIWLAHSPRTRADLKANEERLEAASRRIA